MSGSGTFKDLCDGREKLLDRDRLALVGVEPSGHDLLAVLAHHGRGHGHDGNPPRGLLSSEPSERFDPVNPGQPNVHQDQARAALFSQATAPLVRLAFDGLVPLERQPLSGELAVLVIALDDQDERAGHGRTGSVKVKVEPWPISLCTEIWPPWSSINLRERASPSPVPSAFLSVAPTCRNSSNTASWSPGAMPTPVSVTDTSARSACSRASMSIRPPSGVNLRALDKMFKRTCFTFRSSPLIIPSRVSMVLPSLIPRRLARSRTRVSAFSMALGRSKSAGSSSMRPASIFDRSRMSLMRERGCRPDSKMSCRYSVCFSLISPNIPSARTSENPMMALRGVRSSWLMLARNSDLC